MSNRNSRQKRKSRARNTNTKPRAATPRSKQNVGKARIIPTSELHKWGYYEEPPSKDIVLVGHKVRLYPTPRQQTYFIKCVHASRYAFNRCLGIWQEMYETTGNASAYAVRKQFNAEKAEVSPWMLEVFHGVGKNAAADVG